MKKFVYVAVLTLALVTVACGKKEETEEKNQPIVEEPVDEDTPNGIEDGYVEEGILDEITAEPGEIQIAYEDFSDQITGDGDILLLSVSEHVPVVEIQGQEEIASKINEFFQERHSSFLNDVEAARSVSQEVYDSYSQENIDSFEGFSIGQTYEVLYQSEKFLCMEETQYEWLGSTHPSTFVSSFVFDLQTGEKVLLKEIVENDEEAQTFVADYIEQLIKENYDPEGFYEEYEELLPGLYADDIFYLNEKGVVFISNAYAIAPYAAGKMEFVIPYEDFTLLKEEYSLL